MAIRLKIPKSGAKDNGKTFLPKDPVVRAALVVFFVAAFVVVGSFSFFYVKYDRLIEKRFRSPLFSNAAKIYALPKTLRPGQKISAHEIAAQLRRTGYSESGQSSMGTYVLFGDGIEITPGPGSYHSPDSARVVIRGGKIDSISSRGTGVLV